ncbi:hypothetical protein [Deinococcus roseus]|uniref:Uncharacterized protein n=1 Tax=Deinococcus roseus TaxID=392414 RepID=A0ABQ2D5I9_9DEIO|nr:hypothetical protein [Deinococcus roseus]GGJ43721.1 hypothetical protein GCM10008938_32520 [Deinococcus roseus]
MHDVSSAQRTREDPAEEYPLDLQLQFQYTEQATHPRANIKLLSEGNYRAISFQVYAKLQKCYGCDTAEKAKRVVKFEDQLTREHYYIGLECLQKYYGVSINDILERKNNVARTRRSLASKLRMKRELSFEAMVQVARDAVQAYVRFPDRALIFLDLIKNDIDASNEVQNHIQDIYEMALYSKEWQERPQMARTRWTSLKTHPYFTYGKPNPDVVSLCEQALLKQDQLDEGALLSLLRILREVHKYQRPWKALVDPADFSTQENYQQAWMEALYSHCKPNGYDRQYWAHFHLTDILSVKKHELYAVYAAAPDTLEHFLRSVKQEGSFRQHGFRLVYCVDPTISWHQPPPKTERYRTEDNFMDVRIIEQKPIPYKIVFLGLQEQYLSCYKYWKVYSRAELEYFSP